MDEGEEVGAALVVAGGDVPELVQLVEEALNEVQVERPNDANSSACSFRKVTTLAKDAG
jgi:hypothetical protein